MRSRPRVKTYLRPAVATPGSALEVEVVLTSASETPIDFVEIRLEGREAVQFGRYGQTQEILALVARHGARTLSVGEHRLSARFDLPASMTPSYRGTVATLTYLLDVHVSIPWWPDRRERFAVTVGPRAGMTGVTPQTFLSTLDGPRGTAPFIEASFESTTLEPGGELAGAVSVANTQRSSIRGVDLVLIATESARGGYGTYEQRLGRVRLVDASPDEGKPIPFRVPLGRNLSVGFEAQLFELSWHVEVVVDVVWGADAVLRVPVTLVAPASRARREGTAARWVAPVGHERRAIAWATVAERHGLTSDPGQERMSATIGALGLRIELQTRGSDGLYAVATMRWPDLGIDVHAAPRGLADLLVPHVDLGSGPFARALTVQAREAAQGRALFDDEVVAALAGFTEIAVDDEGATLGSPARAATVPQLDGFVKGALAAARALAFGLARVPAPVAMAADVPAWEGFAQRLGARLDRGGMRIRELRLGTETAAIETLWSRRGEVEGTALRVPMSPPLDGPLDLESPSLSPQARELVQAITSAARAVRFGPDRLEALLEGSVPDPEQVLPLLEQLAQLSRVARGAPDAGPYR